MSLYVLASVWAMFTGHVWSVVGGVRGADAICLITVHGRDLWANWCFR